jgi:hypothetical protein
MDDPVVDKIVAHVARVAAGKVPSAAFQAAKIVIADPLVVVGEIVARKGAVGMLGFVEDWDVRLDPLVMSQPAEHLGRAVGGVADQSGGVESEGFERALDHALGCRHLGLPDRCRRFDIDDNRVVDIDQVIGRPGGTLDEQFDRDRIEIRFESARRLFPARPVPIALWECPFAARLAHFRAPRCWPAN